MTLQPSQLSRLPWTGISAVLAVAVATGCANTFVDPENVGIGRYLHIYRDGAILFETDTHNAGLLNCPNQAYQIIQSNPSLTGAVKCSDRSFPETLIYSFVAHRQLTESDGFRRSSPYVTRTSNIQTCVSQRDATSKLEKTVILEDNCRSFSASSSKVQQPTAKPTSAVPSIQSAPPTAAPASAITDSLRQLEQVRREGLIGEQEYQLRRKAILDRL